MTRPCDAHGCAATVATGKFLCPRHWRMVPLETQRTINSRHRACRVDFAFLSDRTYLQACIAALEGIARDEGRGAVATSYHRLLRGAEARAARGAHV